MAEFAPVHRCRGCDSRQLAPVLSLGRTPLANELLGPADHPRAALYPLDLIRCCSCSLVQLAQVVSPQHLFTNYAYFSSYSETMLEHARQLAHDVIETEHLGDQSLVIEVASNDGYLLQFFTASGVPALGIDPARNVADVAWLERGIPTIVDFMSPRLASTLVAEGRQADLLLGLNVLAHTPALKDFADALRLLLKPHGLVILEVPYVVDMVDSTEFDTVYHEHQSYFSLTALTQLFTSHGLEIVDVQRLPIHGGSLRISASHSGARPRSTRVGELLAKELAWGVNDAAVYAEFAARVGNVRLQLRELVCGLKVSGARLAAYGAAAKGVTLLSACGLGRDQLEFVVDRSPHKQGRRFPIDDLPIYPPSRLREEHIDYALLLTWNFAEEVTRQQADFLSAGGQFIVPVPLPTLLAARAPSQPGLPVH